MGTTNTNPKSSRARRTAVGRVSWLALVAATSLGVAHAGTVRAAIKLSRGLDNDGRYRLIVQSYDRFGTKRTFPGLQRPRASAQRAVTAEDLARGVQIDLVELTQHAERSSGTVVAWVEPGEADLELDAWRARPQAGSIYGMARSDGGLAQVRLNRRV